MSDVPTITALRAQAAELLAQAAALEAQEKTWRLTERAAAKALASNSSTLMRQRMAELRLLQQKTATQSKGRDFLFDKVMEWDKTYGALSQRAELFERRAIDRQVDLEIKRGDCLEEKSARRRSDLWYKHLETLR